MMKDWKFFVVWLSGVLIVSVLCVEMVKGIQENNRQYNQRYELCIKADKQWLDGNCLNK